MESDLEYHKALARELPAQRVSEFKAKVSGRLYPILREIDGFDDLTGIDPAHALEVLLDRVRAMRSVLADNGIS